MDNSIITEINEKALSDIENASSRDELENIRVSLLGKKGSITELLKNMGNLSIEDKKIYGKKINDLKTMTENAISKKREAFSEKDFIEKLSKNKTDITLSGRMPNSAKIHIISQIEEEVVKIFQDIGFIPVEGNELEDDFHNFEALNIPYYHPARDNHDSIFIDATRLLRTHTSGMQIRTMKTTEPPLAILSPGKCVRHDAVDAKHSPVFHQIEGLLVDKNVSFNDLKGCLEYFCKKIFSDKTKIRLRPDFFPFVEPGAELSASCVICGGAGCKTCKYGGWIELMGCGMVHPNVFEHVGYNPQQYSGFAFGMGLERVAMIKYGIPDIRMFYENDIEFLSQW